MPAITKSDTLRLPLLVTRSLVVFPTISEEIEASRAVSINAIQKSMADSNNLLFLVSQKNPEVDQISEENLYSFGTLIRIVDCVEGKDSLKIRVIGSKRVRFSSFSIEDDCVYAEGQVVRTLSGDVARTTSLINSIIALVSANKSLSSSFGSRGLSLIHTLISILLDLLFSSTSNPPQYSFYPIIFYSADRQ